jgi:uncharacterized protein YjcR
LTDNPTPPKKRGAPPGNTNALKHGYYSRSQRAAFSPPELADPAGFADQIHLLTFYIRQVKDSSEQIDSAKNLNEAISTLRVLTLSMASLHRLLRMHHNLLGTVDQKDANRRAIIAAFDARFGELTDAAPEP